MFDFVDAYSHSVKGENFNISGTVHRPITRPDTEFL